MLNWSGWILGYILYVPRNPALFKPIGLALSVLTWQVHVTCFQDTNQWFRRQGRKYSAQSAITFLTDSIRRDMDVRVRFFGKIQIRISESKSGFPNPKTDFEFFWACSKTDHGSIKYTLGVDSSDQIQIRIFEIQNLSVFLGKDLKKVFLTSGFSEKKNGLNLCWWRLIKFEPYHSM